MRRIFSIAASAGFGLTLALGYNFSGAQTPAARATPTTRPAEVAKAVDANIDAPEPVIEKGTIRLIRLPEADFKLPDSPGLETVMTYCVMCHTPAYITLQPPLTREVWTAEVTKMQKVFSGPIPNEKVPEIVDYLVKVNGAASATTKNATN